MSLLNLHLCIRASMASLLRPNDMHHCAAGLLTFPGFPVFKPNLTPKQVIQAHSFGG